MAEHGEQRLLARIAAGDRLAFEELLDAYQMRIYRLALRFTGSVADAEDLTQEIFLAVYQSAASFRGRSSAGTWIYRVAMNHCLEFRRKRRIESVPLEEETALPFMDARDDPLEQAGRSEMRRRVDTAISCLSPVHRDVVVLHELQGLTYQEVAAALDVPVGTVKSRLSNAFRKLRELLGGYVHEGTLV